METILITGGSGLIGKALIPKLIAKNYRVHVLSRSSKKIEGCHVFQWNPIENWIDENAFEGVDHIIHLAGENVGAGRWTKKRKKAIFDSRVSSMKLLHAHLKDLPLKSVISAAGISIYGVTTKETIFQESEALTSAPTDFLADVSIHWETVTSLFKTNAQRIVNLRTPIVLAKDGALIKMAKPIKMGIGSALGTGKQYVPWVHIDDITNAYIFALENSEMNGAYNVSASEHLTNEDLTFQIAKALGKKLWAPRVPAFLLKILFGEMANIILEGSRVHNSKITNAGFEFKYPNIQPALQNIFSEP